MDGSRVGGVVDRRSKVGTQGFICGGVSRNFSESGVGQPRLGGCSGHLRSGLLLYSPSPHFSAEQGLWSRAVDHVRSVRPRGFDAREHGGRVASVRGRGNGLLFRYQPRRRRRREV